MGYLDSRTLEDEIRETESLYDSDEGIDTAAMYADLSEDEADRMRALYALRAELEGYGWEHGIVLIPEDEFEDYARELAKDIGAVPDEDTLWPAYCIDWERAARELATDYSLTTFEGVDYYWREA